jgi:molybdate transport system substrate-binding protein
MRVCLGRAIAVLLLIGPWVGGSPVRAEESVTVFAAASTKDVIDGIATLYTKVTHQHVVASFGSSSELARQIENGAPAAIFLSADSKWMDYLAERHLIVATSRRDLLANELVLIAPARTARPTSLNDLPGALASGRLAMGDPDSVPAGRYGKAALESLRLWNEVETSIVRTRDVRACLTLVERGEVVAGIVYATDALVSPKVRVVASFPAASHPPIVYPAALVAGQDFSGARAFYRFLFGPEAREIFLGAGFSLTSARAPAN